MLQYPVAKKAPTEPIMRTCRIGMEATSKSVQKPILILHQTDDFVSLPPLDCLLNSTSSAATVHTLCVNLNTREWSSWERETTRNLGYQTESRKIEGRQKGDVQGNPKQFISIQKGCLSVGGKSTPMSRQAIKVHNITPEPSHCYTMKLLWPNFVFTELGHHCCVILLFEGMMKFEIIQRESTNNVETSTGIGQQSWGSTKLKSWQLLTKYYWNLKLYSLHGSNFMGKKG